MTKKRIVVAIDGLSSSGKSTMAKDLAKYAGYIYVDTGAMYRALALFAIGKGWIKPDSIDEEALARHIDEAQIGFTTDADGRQQVTLGGVSVEQEIRTLAVGDAASRVSTIGFVRRYLVAQQQAMGRDKGIVMDGRDIATVVFPDAELKVFVTASAEVRARRRYDELQAKGAPADFDAVLVDVRGRDERDMNRAESPLRQVPEARLLDNSALSRDEQRQILFGWFDKVVGR